MPTHWRGVLLIGRAVWSGDDALTKRRRRRSDKWGDGWEGEGREGRRGTGGRGQHGRNFLLST